MNYQQLQQTAKTLGIKTSKKKESQLRYEVNKILYPQKVKLGQIVQHQNGQYWTITKLVPINHRSFPNCGGNLSAYLCNPDGSPILDRWGNKWDDYIWEDDLV